MPRRSAAPVTHRCLQAGVQVACRDSQNAPALYAAMVGRLPSPLTSMPPLGDAEMADLIAFLKKVTNGNNGG